MVDGGFESAKQAELKVPDSSARLRSDADLGMLPKSGMEKVQVAGLFDWLWGSKKNDEEADGAKKPHNAEKHEAQKTDDELLKPSEETLKAFEANKDQIKKECEEKNGAGSQQCDEKQALLPKSGTDTTSGANSHNHSSGSSNMLLYWWLLHNSGRSSSPGYYERTAPPSSSYRPSATTPNVPHTDVAPAGRNPVTGIPNTGRPSGFGSTGGARGVGGSA